MSRAKTFAGALTLVLLASCGSSAQKAAPATSPVSLAIATTAAPTTAAATTTLPPPTVPPTTDAPTTTTISLQDLGQVVRKRHDEISLDLERCIAVPGSCDPTTFTPADSPLRARVVESTKALAEKNWIVRQNVGDPTIARVDSVDFNDTRTVATLKECFWDSAITLKPNGGPNGEDIIVDDGKASFDNVVTMVLSDGRWFISEKKQVAMYEGVNKCAGQ